MAGQQLTGNGRDLGSHRPAVNHRVLYDRWINELWAGQRIADELVSTRFVGHWPTRDVHGPAELEKLVDNTRRALADLKFYVEVGPFSHGDLVAARWIGTGSGKNGPVRLTGNDILRVANGQFTEYWSGTTRG